MTTYQPVKFSNKVDVTIVGGGYTGLLALYLIKEIALANPLKKYSVLLISDGDLGSGQSLHQHGYQGRGYMWGDPVATKKAHETIDFWKDRIKLSTPNIFFGMPESMASSKITSWDSMGLSATSVTELPDFFKDSLLNKQEMKLFALNDFTYNPLDMINYLETSSIGNVIKGKVIKINASNNNSVNQITVQLPNGSHLEVDTRSVILATGVGTRKVLESVTLENNERIPLSLIEKYQFANLTPMICIKVPIEIIPSAFALFLFTGQSGYSLIGQNVIDENDQKFVLFYLTPGVRATTNDALDGNAIAPIDKEIIEKGISNLINNFSIFRENIDRMEWMVYCGWKQGHPNGTISIISEAFPGLNNLFLSLPAVASTNYACANDTVLQVISYLDKQDDAERITVSQDELAESINLIQSKDEVKVGQLEYKKMKWQSFNDFCVTHNLQISK